MDELVFTINYILRRLRPKIAWEDDTHSARAAEQIAAHLQQCNYEITRKPARVPLLGDHAEAYERILIYCRDCELMTWIDKAPILRRFGPDYPWPNLRKHMYCSRGRELGQEHDFHIQPHYLPPDERKPQKHWGSLRPPTWAEVQSKARLLSTTGKTGSDR
jgi:hypothetical protein